MLGPDLAGRKADPVFPAYCMCTSIGQYDLGARLSIGSDAPNQWRQEEEKEVERGRER